MRKILDHGYVKFIEKWGSEEGIIESARQSTDKGFQGWGPKPCPDLIGGNVHGDTGCSKCGGTGLVPGDEKLLRYMWANKHHSPFEFAGMTFEVQAPIFVFREWHRHRTQSYNELSARYTVVPNLYYVPSIERLMVSKQSSKNKQGSEAGFTQQDAEDLQFAIKRNHEASRYTYELLLSKGTSREIARVVLPVAQYSRMRVSTDLRNWLGFLELRTALNAQWEIQQYANEIASFLAAAFPRVHELFIEARA